jgi:hypothetical protein
MAKCKLIITEYEKNEIHVFDYPYGIDGYDKIADFHQSLVDKGILNTPPYGECDHSILENVTITIH